MNMGYDIDRQYLEVKNPPWELIEEVIWNLNGGRIPPRRRGLILLSNNGLLTIDSASSTDEDRVLLRYKRHPAPEDANDFPPYAKLLDPSLPRLDDEDSLVEIVSTSNEVEDVYKYETVPKQLAIEVVEHFFQFDSLPSGLMWNRF